MSTTFYNPNTHLLEDGKGNAFKEGEKIQIEAFEDIPLVKEAYIESISEYEVGVLAWIDGICDYAEIYPENYHLIKKI